MLINKNHSHAAIILILIKLYKEIDTPTLGGWFFNDYANYDDLNEDEKNILFKRVILQLEDLNLVKYKNMFSHTGEVIQPRLSGSAEIILSKLFKDDSLQKFFQTNSMKVDKDNIIVLDVIKQKGIETLIDVFSKSLTDGYSELLKLLK